MVPQRSNMAECTAPFIKTDKAVGSVYQLPCGRCPNCVARRTSQWSFRIMQESKVSYSAHFITLTYKTGELNISPNGFKTLSKRDVQLFFKRLRKAQDKIKFDFPIRYYAVGEYGGKTQRPHYHIILFNALNVEMIKKAWTLGEVHFGKVEGASIGYCLKYMEKDSKKKWYGSKDDRQQEFALMSKGLGKSYMSQDMLRWHKNDLVNRMYCNLEDGRKIGMPRYFKEKIYNENERNEIASYVVAKIGVETDKRYANLSDVQRQQRQRDIEQANIAKHKLMYKNSKKSD